MMRQYVADFLVTVLISALMGVLVGLLIFLVLGDDLLTAIFRSVVVATSIGLVARSTIHVVYLYVSSNPALILTSVAAIIAAGTCLGVFWFRATEWQFYAYTVLFAEFIGLVGAFFLYRYALRLNQSLQQAQKRYTQYNQ